MPRALAPPLGGIMCAFVLAALVGAVESAWDGQWLWMAVFCVIAVGSARAFVRVPVWVAR